MKQIITLIALVLAGTFSNAQTKADIFDKKVPITWLGLDFSELHFIGDAAQWQDVGGISNSELQEKYFVSWNELFHTEKDKYDVADAMYRKKADYAIEVVAAINEQSEKDHFGHGNDEFRHLSEDDIAKMVKAYDYKDRAGLGMVFIVEGLHKEAKKASIWVAYVNMSTKELLLAKQIEGKAGGFGFRNYWAKSFFNGLREVKDNYGKWKKGK
ncbi:MAG: hypothetical protein R2800_02490 [Flavipsychrobacter sp.]